MFDDKLNGKIARAIALTRVPRLFTLRDREETIEGADELRARGGPFSVEEQAVLDRSDRFRWYPPEPGPVPPQLPEDDAVAAAAAQVLAAEIVRDRLFDEWLFAKAAAGEAMLRSRTGEAKPSTTAQVARAEEEHRVASDTVGRALVRLTEAQQARQRAHVAWLAERES